MSSTFVHVALLSRYPRILIIHLQVDGNGWSGRFKRLITSNSLVFKSTLYLEWLDIASS